jgi:hypothetical protein
MRSTRPSPHNTGVVRVEPRPNSRLTPEPDSPSPGLGFNPAPLSAAGEPVECPGDRTACGDIGRWPVGEPECPAGEYSESALHPWARQHDDGPRVIVGARCAVRRAVILTVAPCAARRGGSPRRPVDAAHVCSPVPGESQHDRAIGRPFRFLVLRCERRVSRWDTVVLDDAEAGAAVSVPVTPKRMVVPARCPLVVGWAGAERLRAVHSGESAVDDRDGATIRHRDSGRGNVEQRRAQSERRYKSDSACQCHALTTTATKGA